MPSTVNTLKALREYLKTDIVGYRGNLVARDNYEKVILPRFMEALEDAVKKLEGESR